MFDLKKRCWYWGFYWELRFWDFDIHRDDLQDKQWIRVSDQSPYGEILKEFVQKENQKLKEFLGGEKFEELQSYRRWLKIDPYRHYHEYWRYQSEQRNLADNPNYLEERQKQYNYLEYLANRTPEEIKKDEEERIKSRKKYMRFVFKELFLKEMPFFLFSRRARSMTKSYLKILRDHYLGSAYQKRSAERWAQEVTKQHRIEQAQWERYIAETLIEAGDIASHALNH